jgi:hypothetical protein
MDCHREPQRISAFSAFSLQLSDFSMETEILSYKTFEVKEKPQRSTKFSAFSL